MKYLVSLISILTPNAITQLIILPSLILFSCGQTIEIGDSGKIEGGTVHRTKCTKPSKRYTKEVKVAVDGSLNGLQEIDAVNLNAEVQTKAIKLTDYSTQGLDLDLVLFRLCEISRNRSLTQDQTAELMSQAISGWNTGITIKEQKNILAQLVVELESNLKNANELKLNIETILNSINTVSGDQILRNNGIKILPLLFPASNLDFELNIPIQYLVDNGLEQYHIQGLDTNSLEKQKLNIVANLVYAVIARTLPTLNSLADADGTRYPFESTIWDANINNFSKIEIFDITLFQKTYSEFNSLKNNYNIVSERATDYLEELKNFFRPEGQKVYYEDIYKILLSERMAFDLINTYSKSLIQNIEAIIKLQHSVKQVIE